MSDECKHLDCRNYAPLDVAKGICHRSKELVPADDDHCAHFTPAPKCKFCSHYRCGTEPFLGYCAAVPGQPMAYPDLIAVTCEQFSAKA